MVETVEYWHAVRPFDLVHAQYGYPNGLAALEAGRRLGLPRLWARPTLRMRVGPPVPLDDLRGRDVDVAVLREATDRIMAALTALVAELRGEPAPAVRFDPRAGRAAS